LTSAQQGRLSDAMEVITEAAEGEPGIRVG
jgi:hypothetical protein